MRRRRPSALSVLPPAAELSAGTDFDHRPVPEADPPHPRSAFACICPPDSPRPASRQWEEFLDSRIATVDSFQGSESDAVIISYVRSNENHVIGFSDNPNRINVAHTRCRRELYVVGDLECLKRGAGSRDIRPDGASLPPGRQTRIADGARAEPDATDNRFEIHGNYA